MPQPDIIKKNNKGKNLSHNPYVISSLNGIYFNSLFGGQHAKNVH